MSAGGHYHRQDQYSSPLTPKRRRDDSEEKVSNIRSLLNDTDNDDLTPATYSTMSINMLTTQHPQQQNQQQQNQQQRHQPQHHCEHMGSRVSRYFDPAYRPNQYNLSHEQTHVRPEYPNPRPHYQQQQPPSAQPVASGTSVVQSESKVHVQRQHYQRVEQQQQQQQQQRTVQVIVSTAVNATGQSAVSVSSLGRPQSESDPSPDKLATRDLPPAIRDPVNPMDRPGHSVLAQVTNKMDSATQQPQPAQLTSAGDRFTAGNQAGGGETWPTKSAVVKGAVAAQSGDAGAAATTRGVTRTDVGQSSSDARFRPYPDLGSSSLAESATVAGDEQHSSADRHPQSAASEPSRQDDSQAQQRRRRRTQACEYCHLKKIKCEGEGTRCINCIKNDIQCMWGQKRKRGPKPKPLLAAMSSRGRLRGSRAQRAAKATRGKGAMTVITSVPGQVPMPSIESDGRSLTPVTPVRDERTPETADYADIDAMPEGLRVPSMHRELKEFFSGKVDPETREAVAMYFDYFYPLCPIFHPSLFIRRVVENDIDPILIDAMKATTARMVTAKTGRFVDGDALAESVKSRIISHLESPSIDYVRTLVVMTLLAGCRGEHLSYNSLIVLAASLVTRCGWHQIDLYRRPPPATWEEWVNDQIKRRIFWIVYQTDSYQSMLTGRGTTLNVSSVYVRTPCSDFEWDIVLKQGDEGQSLATHVNASNARSRVRHHRSSLSSSGSSSSMMQSMRVDQDNIVATGALSYSFMSLSELTTIISDTNMFLCDAKASRDSLGMLSGSPLSNSQPFRNSPFPALNYLNQTPGTGRLVYQPQRTVRLVSEYPQFAELDSKLQVWKRDLVLPEELRDDAMPACDISYFGQADHRRFMMRVRYFCLHCYYVPIAIFLHQSNRPSFFTEYEEPPELRGSDPDTDGSAESGYDAVAGDRALREMLNMAFANTWNAGLVANDIEESSWQVCLDAAHGLSEHLERNNDMPLERFDQVIPFCIFMSSSVLLRQTKKCRRILAMRPPGQDLDKVRADIALCTHHLRGQWTILKGLGELWNVEGMEMLLKSMQIDEVTSAADLFSSLSL